MTDDLSNQWGRQLIFNLSTSEKRKFAEGTRAAFKDFAMIIKKDTKAKFHLGRVVCCGSDANMFATMEASAGDTGAVFIACGSYVAGDDGPCANWTSSGYDAFQLNTNIAHPDEICRSTRVRTVALPYHIRVKDSNKNKLVSYENECFRELHMRCLLMKIEGRPLRCLLLELLLGGNGGELSDRFLEMLGLLAKHHDFSIVVDECITGGRIGPTMLLTQSKPSLFQDAVSHITLGKWPGLGIVLRSKECECQLPKPMFPRGMTTQLQTTDAQYSWERVSNQLSYITIRRQQVLKFMKVAEEHCWGRGLVIFSERHRKDTSSGGLKNRYLPMNELIKPATIGFTSSQPGYTKNDVADRLLSQGKTWLTYSAQQGSNTDRSLCDLLSANKPQYMFSIKDLSSTMRKMYGIDSSETKQSLRHAVDNKLVDMKVRSKKRVLIGIANSCCSLTSFTELTLATTLPSET